LKKKKARRKDRGRKIRDILRVLMSQATLFVRNLLNEGAGVGGGRISRAEYYFGKRRLAKLIHNPTGGVYRLGGSFLKL